MKASQKLELTVTHNDKQELSAMARGLGLDESKVVQWMIREHFSDLIRKDSLAKKDVPLFLWPSRN